ncbi:MAG: hypothetical protein PHP46_06105 [Candidatus Omnitrophica bacterium]|nr:hypothetical protein [Candidatus Omnitrophota bacterium]
MKKNKVILEIILAFFIYDCVNYIFFRNNPAFATMKPHPYWLVVLLISSRYGFVPGVITGLIASAHLLIAVFGGIPSKTDIEKLIEYQNFITPIGFTIVGAVLGSIRQGYINSEREKRQSFEKLEGASKMLQGKLEAADKMRTVLEARIVGETTTVKTLYEVAKKFDILDETSIYKGCLDILAKYFQVEKASIYVISGGYYIIKAFIGWQKETAVEGKIAAGNTIMDIAQDSASTITVKDIIAYDRANKYRAEYGKVLAMFPLKNESGEVFGVVNIEKMDFLSFTNPNIQLIEIIINWAARSLCNKRLFDHMKRERIMDEKLSIFTFEHFNDVVAAEFKRARVFGLDLAVAIVKLNQFGLHSAPEQDIISRALIALMGRFMHDADMLFRYRYEGTFAVVSPMKKEKDIAGAFDNITGEMARTMKGAGAKEAPLEIVVGISGMTTHMSAPQDLLTPALKKCGIAHV